MSTLRILGVAVGLSLAGCATTPKTSSSLGEDLTVLVRGQPIAKVSPHASDIRFYLQPAREDQAARVRACARYKPTGSRILRDTCRSPTDPTEDVSQTALKYEQMANAALERTLRKGPLPLPAEGGAFVVDATEEYDQAVAINENHFENPVSGSSRAFGLFGQEVVEN